LISAPVASDILMNLSHAGSTYAQSFGEVHAEIEKALEDAKARLRCFATVLPWIQDMYRISSLDKTLKGEFATNFKCTQGNDRYREALLTPITGWYRLLVCL